MKTHLLPHLVATALGVITVALPATSYSQTGIVWKGPGGTGDSGTWTNANFSANTGDIDTFFDTDATYTSLDTVVTIGAGVTARTRALVVRNYEAGTTKNVTINLGDGSYLNTGRTNSTAGVINAGGGGLSNPTQASSSILTINGPESGTATFRARRLYMEGNGTVNAGTPHRNSLIINGSGLNLILDGSFTAAGARSDILFDGGVNVTTTPLRAGEANAAGAFWTREGMTSGLYDNWITVKNATISLHLIEARGLFQLGSQGTLIATKAIDNAEAVNQLTIRVGDTGVVNGRFEAAGSGIDKLANVTVYSQNTFAIGLSDPATGISAAADTFTLNQTFTFDAGSLLEFDLFGSAANEVDQLIIGEEGSLTNIGAGARVVINLNGYTVQAGDEWSLIDDSAADANWLTGDFDLSLIDTNIWDISAFNAAGNWTLRSAEAIPEPSTFALTAFAALAAAGWMKRRRSA